MVIFHFKIYWVVFSFFGSLPTTLGAREDSADHGITDNSEKASEIANHLWPVENGLRRGSEALSEDIKKGN